MKLRLAGIVPESIVDGPGIRLAIFFQGCPHRCPGCHNPETHDPAGGMEVEAAELLRRIREARGIDGVTFSGGEPFEQAAALAGLAEEIRRLGLDLVLYSGYTFEALLQKGEKEPHVRRLLEAGRLLVDGPYMEAERDLTLPYRGSRNQRLIDLPRSLAAGAAVEWEA
ncbi:MAG: anaerobic ribonucleoside-triphosphate reductase activating protein [Firmicutes bacterium]|jgi:anaerobic ribonucleoside-triphosphate reductase activating protein|nr:anaerobic ribonucleoside-triphosphate reductase activating protein [Bacillota bacterium]HPU01341.1 anaerobic ribonucleoside-triphosphate reductase activating protein [Bacillota bacterium]